MEGKVFGVPLLFVAAGVFILIAVGLGANAAMRRVDKIVTPVCPFKTCPVCPEVATVSATTVDPTLATSSSKKKVIKFVIPTPTPTTEGTGI
jgi:hypothetical protein